MKTITYVRPVPLMKGIFGGFLCIAAFFVIFTTSILFGFFIMAFGVYLASTEGSQINLDDKTYRTIWSLFGVHIGKWKPIPKFEYISVFKGKQKQRVNSLGASTTFTEDVILVNLFYSRNKHHTFYRTFSKEKAFEVANHFKLALDIDILNATEKKQKWL
ncbi:hypothetical protein FEE95_10770 [Maribacter algarum]|uniref:Uncharacterized protein n=1 Tax=Maribacter algarum (ex Zhang et al. 2020) TaxID=2578118 RepID=A0A5S3PVH4_9FLAO|nr:hypothetical protein [Maribacter algarum]TMM56968.1 hypothetical protein FEE95_10770 [Maribacter algarum]